MDSQRSAGITLFYETEDKERNYYEAQTDAEPLMFALPQNRPTPTIHAAMLAIQYNQGSNVSGLADWLKKKGFITSNNTIYGYGTRQGVFDTAVSLGFIEKRKGGYKLTDKGRKWVDPDTILEG